MTRDRLRELKGALQVQGSFSNEEDGSDDDECQDDRIGELTKFMTDFSTKVNLVRMMITLLAEHVDKVSIIQKSILSQPGTTAKTLKIELDGLMGKIKKIAGQVHGKLKAMQKDVRSENMTPAQQRIKETQYNALASDMLKVMTDYNKIQTYYRDKCKARIQRQLSIAGKHMEDDELEDMLENGTKQNIFLTDIIVETEQARKSLEDVKARHEDIVRLEDSIKKLHQLFMDMTWMVQKQGDMLNSIEKHVEKSKDWVGVATAEIKRARIADRRYRKKQIIILTSLLLVVTVATVVGFFGVGLFKTET